MAKKFEGLQNPAMQFITPAQAEADQGEDKPAASRKEAKKAVKEPEKATSPAKVKTTGAPKGYKVNPLYVETKSRRMQLLVQPSLHEAIKAKALEEGQSVNELVHSILEAALMKGE